MEDRVYVTTGNDFNESYACHFFFFDFPVRRALVMHLHGYVIYDTIPAQIEYKWF